MPIYDAAGGRLVTASQAAQLIGILPSAVSKARDRGAFPDPAEWVDARTPVWREADLGLTEPVPAEMRKLQRWVPAAARRPVADPEKWENYAAVRRPAAFVLDGDGVACVRIDHCLRADSAALFATELIEWWSERTFTEVTAQGDGLQIWGYAEADGDRKVRHVGHSFEVLTDGRAVLVTGDRYRNAPSLLADLTQLIAEIS